MYEWKERYKLTENGIAEVSDGRYRVCGCANNKGGEADRGNVEGFALRFADVFVAESESF